MRVQHAARYFYKLSYMAYKQRALKAKLLARIKRIPYKIGG